MIFDGLEKIVISEQLSSFRPQKYSFTLFSSRNQFPPFFKITSPFLRIGSAIRTHLYDLRKGVNGRAPKVPRRNPVPIHFIYCVLAIGLLAADIFARGAMRFECLKSLRRGGIVIRWPRCLPIPPFPPVRCIHGAQTTPRNAVAEKKEPEAPLSVKKRVVTSETGAYCFLLAGRVYGCLLFQA